MPESYILNMQAICEQVHSMLHSELDLGQLEFFTSFTRSIDASCTGDITQMHPTCIRVALCVMLIDRKYERIHPYCLYIVNNIHRTVLNDAAEMEKYDYHPFSVGPPTSMHVRIGDEFPDNAAEKPYKYVLLYVFILLLAVIFFEI